MAAATSNEMKSYRFRTFTGPVDVNVVADRLRDAGIDAHAGTEHVYGSIRASNRVAAIDRINEAARFQLVSWNDLHLKDGISEPAGSSSEGDPSAMGDVVPPRPTAPPKLIGRAAEAAEEGAAEKVGGMTIRRVHGAQAEMAKKDLGLVKITRESAKALYDAGAPITMVGSNVNSYHFFGGWHLAYTVDPKSDEAKYSGQFDVIANSFNAHLEPELGRHPAFFVAQSDLDKAAGGAGSARETDDPVRAEIVDSMARTLFVEAWANREKEMRHTLRGELMDQAPPTPRSAYHQARAVARDIEKINGQSLEALYAEAAAVPGKHYREPTPSDFGHYLVMQAMGHGVSWYDDHPKGVHPIRLPRIESFDLDRQANEGAEEISVSRSVRWDLQNGMYRGVGRRGTYVVLPAYREGHKGGGWLAMKGDEELGWGARAEHAIDIADTYDLEGKRSKYWRDVPAKVEMHAHEAGPGGALDWKQGADGSWASPAPTGGASYVISPDDKGGGLTVWYMPHHGQASVVSHNQSLGAAMMAASRDVNDKAGYQSAAEERVPVVHERGSEEQPRRVEPGDQPHHHFHVTDEQHTVHVSPDGKVKPVKNLGWLLKHWTEVERFEVIPWGLHVVGGTNLRYRRVRGVGHWEALMIAILRDGGRYESLWSSRTVLRDWLHRPVFRGVPVTWFGEQTAAENVREDFRTKEGAERFAASMGATHITDGKECHLYFPHEGHYERHTLFRKEQNWHIGRRKEKVKKLPGDAKVIAKEASSQQTYEHWLRQVDVVLWNAYQELTKDYGDRAAAMVTWWADGVSPEVAAERLHRERRVAHEESPRDIPFDEIKPGDRVTMLSPQKQEHTGRAVMRGPAGWVLNMGGPHGTPGVATPENFVRARRVAREADESGTPIDWSKWKDSYVGHVRGEKRFLIDPTVDGWLLWKTDKKTGVQTTKVGSYESLEAAKMAAARIDSGERFERRVREEASNDVVHWDGSYGYVHGKERYLVQEHSTQNFKGGWELLLLVHGEPDRDERTIGQFDTKTEAKAAASEYEKKHPTSRSRAGEPRFSWVKPPADSTETGVGAANEAREFAHVERDPAAVSAGRQKSPITSPRDVYEFVHEDLDKRSQECFLVIPLDLHGQPLSPNPYLVAMGQRDRVSVDMSDVMRPVVETNAAGFIVAHGHPSGHCNPSQADKDLTKQIRETTETSFPSVAFIDHCVVGEASVHSIVEGKTYQMGPGKEGSTPRRSAKRGRRRRAH